MYSNHFYGSNSETVSMNNYQHLSIETVIYEDEKGYHSADDYLQEKNFSTIP
jgi:hypothetical protein